MCAAHAAEEKAEISVKQSSAATVFRSVGADGVVEFNDYGVGEVLVLDVTPELDASEVRIVRERQREILEVSQVLASDRYERESDRLSARQLRLEEKARLERERLATLRAAETVYYPARWPLYSPVRFGRRANVARRQGRPRYVYAPDAGEFSSGLGNSGDALAPSAPPEQRRNIEPGYRGK